MASIPYDVAEAFARGRTAHRGAFHSTGRELYSYGLKLAHIEEGRIVLDHDLADHRSVTTARHIRALLAVLPRTDWPESERKAADARQASEERQARKAADARQARIEASRDSTPAEIHGAFEAMRATFGFMNDPKFAAYYEEPPAAISEAADQWLRGQVS